MDPFEIRIKAIELAHQIHGSVPTADLLETAAALESYILDGHDKAPIKQAA